jgi:hypothetical protein
MIIIGHFKIYFGTESWGWNMYGIGWKSMWFLGFSKNVIKVRG